ncbi:MAG: HD domain-containing protein [Candidatus Eisenbacteria bacterium]|nr:HD domain-containing protein [Candidatus Eisenbacteria bacterium]
MIVGGWVRDALLGVASSDIDVEVFGMGAARLEETLQAELPLILVGKAFAVYKVEGADVEFSLPRRDSLVGAGHRGFSVETLPELSFEEAARRRDFTMNAMGLDPFTADLLDPWSGQAHLDARMLEVVDPARFGDDPLRVLRAAQFLSRFLLAPSPRLIGLSRSIGAEALPAERVFGEVGKLLRGARPSLGFRFLLLTGWIRFLPEIAALIGLPQEAQWHPEGDAWEHVLRSLDEAAAIRVGDDRRDLLLMLGVLCHDLGKAPTTCCVDGRVRSMGHSEAGVALAAQLLTRMTTDRSIIAAVEKLVRWHLAPDFLFAQAATPAAVRRLARRLAPDVDIELLERCSRADYRGTSDRGGQAYPAGTWLLDTARAAGVLVRAEEPVLLGRHLLAAGLAPGPMIGVLLRNAYEIQIDEDIHDVLALRDRVMAAPLPLAGGGGSSSEEDGEGVPGI